MRLFALLLVPLVAALAVAQSTPKKPATLAENYDAAIAAARTKYLGTLDKLENQVRGAALAPAQRENQLERLADARAKIAAGTNLSTDGAFVEAGYQYLVAVNNARRPVAIDLRRQLSAAITGRKNDEAKRLEAELKQVDARLPDRDRLTRPGKWVGQQQGPAGTVQVRLVVRKCVGDRFEGELWKTHPNGHVGGMEVAGATDGVLIGFTATRALRGSPPLQKYEGYLFGDHLVLEMTALNARAGVVNRFAILKQ
jgi:hypothetical protein